MAFRWALMLGVAGMATSLVPASEFQFRELPAQRVERMNKEARQNYEQALAHLDRINYDRALESLQTAVEKEPDNPWLRFSVVQVATYLGDTRSGADSIHFYEIASTNLKAIAESPRLNAREKERANQTLETVSALRQSVIERDEKRIQFGRDIAKQHANEIYKKDQSEKDKAEKDARKKPVVGSELNKALAEGTVEVNTEGGSATSSSMLPGETRDLKSPTPTTNGSGTTNP